MEEKKKAPFPGIFSKNSKNLQYFYRFCFELSLLVTRYKNITNFYMHFNLSKNKKKENKSLYENINVKGKWIYICISHCVKKRAKSTKQ